jgi:hypothetical protein
MTRIMAVLVLLSTFVQTAAAQLNDPRDFSVGDKVQLQGCVIAGERDGTFVFSRVTAWPVQASILGEYGPRHFWLKDAGPRLADHLGQTVQVSGVITEIRESEIEREPGSSPVGDRVAIELPSGDVFTSPDLAGIPDAQLSNREDMKITLLKVRVESLMTVMKTCLPQF